MVRLVLKSDRLKGLAASDVRPQVVACGGALGLEPRFPSMGETRNMH